ncbi:hypothetical protein BB558_006095 [Smittium angustum]|uniref:Efficient mitochondria targeting-associated protein 19 n=1 Tax=Smittium angustum TaxID=133377 RepID=A0A2U1IYX7_SMIAN|nr:hypothetical protein BB558_006095 [Smittium angustum]
MSRFYNQTVLLYSIIHLLFSFITDVTPLISEKNLPKLHLYLNDIITTKFNDPFMKRNAPDMIWFRSMLVAEMVIQIPLLIMIIFGLTRNKKPSKYTNLLHLVYGLHVSTTMIPVVGHLLCAPELTNMEKTMLFGMYLPFAIVPFVMTIFSLKGIIVQLNDIKPKLN